MFVPFLRGCLFVVFMFWYSVGIWNYIDDYFRVKFLEVLRKENETLAIKKPSLAETETCSLERSSKQCKISPEDRFDDKSQNVCTLREYFESIFHFNIL